MKISVCQRFLDYRYYLTEVPASVSLLDNVEINMKYAVET